MTLAYLDCFSGISGDMFLGALLHAGLDLQLLRDGLSRLPLEGYRLDAESVTDHSLQGIRALVHPADTGPGVAKHHRHLAEIEAMIRAAKLPERARDRSLAIFARLAQAEATLHGVSLDEVGFAEVGAIDSIVDIVGASLGLELLGIDELFCSELPMTSGRVETDHGPLPIPAPATLAVLQGTDAVWRPLPAEGELVTPTGAAIVAELAQFRRPMMHILSTGYGFGRMQLPWANCLRILVGVAPGAPVESTVAGDDSSETDEVVVLETNIDTMSGEALGWLMEQLAGSGALDVAYLPLHMKKNRPGILLQVIARPKDADRLARQMLRESSTLGIRLRRQPRMKAARRIETIDTPFGSVRIKLKVLAGEVIAATPEYEDCSRLASVHHLPVEQVMHQVTQAAGRQFGLW
ncbi:MAG: nickel pincer cofactor biosynthesis protein LarC [Chloroflexi bacterium]|nr:MAG: nickel pincer cofactor biosynthesis protein LarC [Chloroflexota bacterium]